MAKKTARGGFNMSAEIRNILTEFPEASGRETLEKLKERFPKQTINANSFSMAYSTARKKLGLAPLRKSKKKKVRRKAAAERQGAQVARSTTSAVKLNLDALQSAARFLAEVGSAEAAIAAIKQVQALQIR